MDDRKKTKAQLIEELNQLRRQTAAWADTETPPVTGEVRPRAAEARQSRLWQVEDQLREAVGRMGHSDDFSQVLEVLKRGLDELEIPFQDCGVNLIDLQADPPTVTINSLGKDGHWYDGKPLSQSNATLLQIWQARAGMPVYRRDIQAEDLYQERGESLRYYGHQVRSVVDVPFAFGTLAVNSEFAHAFSTDHLTALQRLAKVLEEGLRRKHDLQRLEQRNQDLENEIAAHRATEVALRSSEEQHRGLFAHMAEGLAYCRMLYQGDEPCDFVYLSVNEAFGRLTGMAEVEGRPVTALIPGIRQNNPELFEIYNRVVRSGSPEKFETYVEGLQRWFSISVYRPERGHFVAVFDVITERKQAEAALRQSEELVRSLFEGHTAVKLVIDAATGQIRDANPAAARFYGWTREQLIQMHIQDINLLPPDEVQRRMAAAEAGAISAFEFRHRRADDSVREVEVFSSRLENNGAVLLYSIIHDLTERKHLEQELIRIQRQRALGELSTGVSHNLNNLLTGVLGPAEMLQKSLTDPRSQRLVGMVVDAGTRAAELVRRLHLSVQASTQGLEAIDLNATIDQSVLLTRPKWKDEPLARGYRIEVRAVLLEVPPIKGHQEELLDLLTNLMLNAVEAMPAGGQITIHTVREGALVRLDVGDTGIGMDEATRLRVFEPFFTTKMNVGSGLGLSTLYNSMTRWGGRVSVASVPGKGATFTLHFPVWIAAT
ncbi:MAG: PAS domain S-box protein [Candidatus Latescibacteria bacterium]|nr:PAS domain S-box protein [Candidatus Latescibacterota bacterium]